MPIIHEMDDGTKIIEEVRCEGCGKDFDEWEDIETCDNCGSYFCKDCIEEHYLEGCEFSDLEEDC